jgi:mannose-6-phosphate isomerase-like protein (cupin superfamily)
MFAGQKHLDNLCLLVDQNNGQLDISSRMVFPMPKLESVFAAFDWQVHCSACVIRVAPGEKVRPAHSHPQGEEVIYIIRGSGRVLVAGEVSPVREGTTVLFPQGAVHMLHNTGSEEMKVICFFAPSTGLENYRMYEDVDFPD